MTKMREQALLRMALVIQSSKKKSMKKLHVCKLAILPTKGLKLILDSGKTNSS